MIRSVLRKAYFGDLCNFFLQLVDANGQVTALLCTNGSENVAASG